MAAAKMAWRLADMAIRLTSILYIVGVWRRK
jgi:hypothetical protein